MGVLSSIMAAPTGDPLHPWWYNILGRKVTSGVHINHSSAMNYSAVWAATRLLTGTISTLPRELYERTGTSKEPAKGHPTRRMFKLEPNDSQGAVVHLEQQFNYLLNWGNAFAEKVRDEFGRVVKTWPIHPSRIPKENYDEERDIYYVKNDTGLEVTPIRGDDMFHVPGLFVDDCGWGKGVIDHAAESIGMGIATEQFGASFFGNGAGPAMVLTHPKTLGAEAADNLRRSWNKRYSGPDKAHGVLVLEEGTTVTPITIPPEQAQYLSTRQFNVTEIARWYNVPPHLLRELSKSSFNNIESESLHFILISVLPWLVRWESECNRQLLIDSEKESLYFKFIVHGMLRGDMKTQSQFFREMFNIGVYDINEIRELLDMNPVEGGDLRLVPMNMTTLEKAGMEPETPNVPGATEPIGDDDEDTDEDASTATIAANQAVRHSLASVLTGMVNYESRQSVRMANNPKTFEEKCVQWYDEKFSNTFAREVGPVLACCKALGASVEIGAFTTTHVERSKRELLSLLDKPVSEFVGAVQETVDSWDSRVFEEVDSVLGKS